MNKLILAVLICIGLTGCNVSPREAQEAEALCFDHYGVKFMLPHILYEVEGMCKDGTRIHSLEPGK